MPAAESRLNRLKARPGVCHLPASVVETLTALPRKARLIELKKLRHLVKKAKRWAKRRAQGAA